MVLDDSLSVTETVAYPPSRGPLWVSRFAAPSARRRHYANKKGRLAAALTLQFDGEGYDVRSGTGAGAGGWATGVDTSVDGPEPGAIVMVSPGLASG